jgi:hypothetical protein
VTFALLFRATEIAAFRAIDGFLGFAGSLVDLARLHELPGSVVIAAGGGCVALTLIFEPRGLRLLGTVAYYAHFPKPPASSLHSQEAYLAQKARIKLPS